MKPILFVVVTLLVIASSMTAHAAPKDRQHGGPVNRVSSVSDSYVGVRHVPDSDEDIAPLRGRGGRPSWVMQIGDGLVRQTLARWASVAGWQFEWDVAYDFPVTLEAEIRGSFEDAVEAVMTSLLNSERPVQAIMYSENRTLRIVPYRGNPHVGR